MKKIKILLMLTLLFTTFSIFAQDGRPQYKIRNERAGVYIGDIIIELFPYVAPLHVANFDSLVTISFYDSTAWHRVVPDFVIQGGDPNSKHGPRNTWGNGDTSQATVPAEFSKVSHLRGILGAARDTDINSATSQFYINTADNTGLDGNYTAYGIVVDGMDVADDIESSPRDGRDNPIEKIEMFITKLGVNESVPGIPQLMEPADGAIGFTPDTKFVWEPVDEAVLYFLEIAEDSNFSSLVFADSFAVTPGNIEVNYYDIELGEKTFYWRVRSNNGAKFSAFSEVRSFTTSIEAPILQAPEYAATDVSTDPMMEWNPVQGAATYKLQITPNFPNFSESRMIHNESGISTNGRQIEGLEANTKYCWRVQCEAEGYDSPFSEVWYFTTGDLTGIEDDEKIPSEYSLSQNYPNPFNPVTSINYTVQSVETGHPGKSGQVVPSQQIVTLKIYDILGREIITLVNKLQPPGRYDVVFNGSDLPSGIYYYRLEAGNYSASKKMVLLK